MTVLVAREATVYALVCTPQRKGCVVSDKAQMFEVRTACLKCCGNCGSNRCRPVREICVIPEGHGKYYRMFAFWHIMQGVWSCSVNVTVVSSLWGH